MVTRNIRGSGGDYCDCVSEDGKKKKSREGDEKG